MPSLENWEWDLKIFDGEPTLTTHVNHLATIYTITQIQSLLTYNIVHQTTYLHKARVNAKVVLSAVVSISYPTTRGGRMLKVICNNNLPGSDFHC